MRGIKGSGASASVAGLSKKLSNLVVKATHADLEEMDKEIREREAELRGLKSLRECLAERVLNSPNCSKPRVAPSSAASLTMRVDVAEVEDIRSKVLTWLNHQGPTTDRVIQKQFAITEHVMNSVMDCKYFVKKFKVWEITSEGYAALELAKDDKD